jgi:hypothetical protein
MTEQTVEKPARVKRSASELKQLRIAKAQARLDKVNASGTKILERAKALKEKADAAQAKADGFAEILRHAEASLAWEQSRPVKGEALTIAEGDEPFEADETNPFENFDESALVGDPEDDNI